jgi:type VI secretion system secreted protein Hcp
MAAYIKFDGVDGESVETNHKDWSEITHFEQVIKKGGSGTGVTRRRGDVELDDIIVQKKLDKSSTTIMQNLCKGHVYKKVDIHVTASYTNAGKVTYYAYELKNVQVLRCSVSGNAALGGGDGAPPMESLTLNFEEIKVTYTECDKEGKKKGNAEYTWKVEEGTT